MDMKAKKELFRLEHDNYVYWVSFHNDLIISSSHDKTTRIWNKSNGEQLHSLMHEGKCETFDINTNGTLIAVAHAEGVSIWSLANYDKVSELKLSKVTDVRFQTNDKIIATLTDGQAHLITTA